MLHAADRASCRIGIVNCLTLAAFWTGELRADSPAITAAKKRQASTISVDVSFQRSETVKAGSVSDLAATFPGQVRPKKPIPPRESQLHSSNRLVINRECARYENNHPTYFLPSGAVLERRKVTAFDGSVAKTLYPLNISGKGRPVGSIDQPSYLESIRALELEPLLLAVRGDDVNMCPYPARQWKSNGAKLPVDGVMCDEYYCRLSDRRTIIYWVDPGAEYVVRRFQVREGRAVTQNCNVSYDNPTWGITVPSRWTITQASSSGIISSIQTVQITEYQANGMIPKDSFSITFPEGTTVYNRRNNKTYLSQGNGQLFEIAEHTEGAEVVVPPRRVWPYLVAPCGLVIVYMMLRYVGKLKRQSKSNNR